MQTADDPCDAVDQAILRLVSVAGRLSASAADRTVERPVQARMKRLQAAAKGWPYSYDMLGGEARTQAGFSAELKPWCPRPGSNRHGLAAWRF